MDFPIPPPDSFTTGSSTTSAGASASSPAAWISRSLALLCIIHRTKLHSLVTFTGMFFLHFSFFFTNNISLVHLKLSRIDPAPSRTLLAPSRIFLVSCTLSHLLTPSRTFVFLLCPLSPALSRPLLLVPSLVLVCPVSRARVPHLSCSCAEHQNIISLAPVPL